MIFTEGGTKFSTGSIGIASSRSFCSFRNLCTIVSIKSRERVKQGDIEE